MSSHQVCKVGTVTWIRQDSLKINTGNEGQQHAKHLRSLGWDTAMSPSLQSYGSPKPPSLSLYTPARGAPSLRDRRLPGPQGLPLILLQCPAPALPGGVGRGVAPGRAVQPQLLAPAETLRTGVHLHPRRLCTGLEQGSAPRCRSPPAHRAKYPQARAPHSSEAYPGRRATGRRWQCHGRSVPHTRTGPRPLAARG